MKTMKKTLTILALVCLVATMILATTSCDFISGLLPGENPDVNDDPGTGETPDNPAHVHTEVVDAAVAATCTEAGKTEGKHCSECNEIIVAQQTVEAKGHAYGDTVLEGEDGFYQECGACGDKKSVTTPTAEGYKASINGEFASAKANSLTMSYTKGGAWGITTNGKFKNETGTPEHGALGQLDAAGNYVYYEFILDKAGRVDIAWDIAGSNWNGSGNDGLADMAAHMTITIDGKPVDIAGITLPKGEGDVAEWWNLQKLVIEDVALDAGTHTIKCDIIAAGGLNAADMVISSNKSVSVNSAEVTGVDIVVKEDKVYYAITANINGYKAEDIRIWGDADHEFITEKGENGATVILVDVTDFAINQKINPHMSFGDKKYVNDDNLNGDLRGPGIVYEEKVVKHGDKYYMLYKEWEMPSLMVVEAVAQTTAADIFVENDKVYYTLTYKIIGYDPATFEFFDGNTVYAVESYETNGTSVTFKFNVTDYEGDLWPHLRINGSNWDGGNGDVKVDCATKQVELNGRTYILKEQWDMPTVVHG